MSVVVMYITDCGGKRYWRTNCTLGHHQGERANMERCLQYAKSGRYRIDAATARLVVEVDGVVQEDGVTQADRDLLADLGL